MVDFSRVDFERLATNNKILGEGAGGVVHGPITLNNNIEYAIKRVWFKKDQYDSMRKKIATKANIWMSLENRNLMKIHFVRLDPNVFILMEYAAGGSLCSTLNKIRCTLSKLPVNVVADWSKQIAEGMLYLQDKKLVHRDLKTGNSEYNRSTVYVFL